MNDLPIIEETLEEDIQDSEEFKNASRKAHSGQYDVTLFEMWDNILSEAVAQCEAKPDINLTFNLLRQWPFLKHEDIEPYLAQRLEMLLEAIEVLDAQLPMDRDKLFDKDGDENVDDWEKHGEAYWNTVIEWTRLVFGWAEIWKEIPFSDPSKPILQAVTMDLSHMLIDSRAGLVEHISNLAGFEATEEMQAEFKARIEGTEADDE